MRKQADLERQEAVDNLSQAVSTNNVLTQAKKKLEGTIGTLQEEAEDLENEAKIADDKAKKALFEVRFKVFFWLEMGGVRQNDISTLAKSLKSTRDWRYWD